MTHRNIVFALTKQNINILQIFFILGFSKHSTGSNIRFLPQRGRRQTIQMIYSTRKIVISLPLANKEDKTRGRRGGSAGIQI